MVNRNLITKLLTANKSKLFFKYHLRSMGVFGSVARDDCNENSDIDILIDYEQPMGIEFIDLADDLEKILQHKVDLVSKKGIKPMYFKEIEKDLIYV